MAFKELLTDDSIGTSVQGYDAGLADIAALSPADSNVLIGDGSNWVKETGSTARTSLGAAASGANTDITSMSGVTSIARGSAGTVSLWADAGTNEITIGGAGTTINVAGDFKVSGTTTTIETTNLSVEDNVITLNAGQTGSATIDAGIEIERGDDTNVCLYYDESLNHWAIKNGSIASGDTSTTQTAFIGLFKAVNLSGAPVDADFDQDGQWLHETSEDKLYIKTS